MCVWALMQNSVQASVCWDSAPVGILPVIKNNPTVSLVKPELTQCIF